jgi:hypothetical protein
MKWALLIPKLDMGTLKKTELNAISLMNINTKISIKHF